MRKPQNLKEPPVVFSFFLFFSEYLSYSAMVMFFFWSIYYIVDVLFLKYIKRYANRCIVMWSSKKLTLFSLTRQLKRSTGHSGHTRVCTSNAEQTQNSHTAYWTERLFDIVNLIFIWINLLYIHLYTYYVFLCRFADKV